IVDYAAGAYLSSVVVGDFNGDGKPDLAVANLGSYSNKFTDGSVSVLLGNGDGTYQAAVGVAAGTRSEFLAVGDFNSDGKLDLVVASQAACSSNCTPGNLSLLLGKGDGTFNAAVSVSSNRADNYPYSVAVGDFNGDGKPDLVVADYFSYHGIGNVSVLPGNGDGTFQAAIRSDRRGYYQSMTVGDFNGDGKLDLVLLSGSISVLLGDGV